MKKQLIYTMALLLTGATAIAQIDRSVMPKSGPSPEINLENPYTFKLKNGMKVLVVEDSKLPQITYSLTIDNPPVYEGDKVGVQSLTGALMGKGTQKLDKDTFNEQVEFMGARVSVGANGGFGFGLAKYKEDILELMSQAALMPKFTQEELDFEKDQLIQGIKAGENSAEAIAGTVRDALVYGKNHPAGEFSTEKSINSVTLEDINNYYKNNFLPNNAYFVVSGDIKKNDAEKLVNKYFKDWKKGTVPTFTYPAVNDVSGIQIDFIDVPNAVQTELAVINTSELKMTDKDYYAALVANYIYGGGFGSYLNMNLREANGYTYGAGSSLGAGRNYKSTFRSVTKVRNEVTDSAVVNTLKEMKRIRTEPVDEVILANAKAKFLGSFIMQSEDKEVVARRAINVETNGLDKDFYKNYISNINKVTKEDVQKVANKYFKIDNSRIVLVGKASDIQKNIENIEYNGKMIPVNYFDKYANPIDRPEIVSLPAGVDNKSVLASYIEAIGGADKVKAIKSVMISGTMQSPQGELNMTEKKMMGDMWKQEMGMGGNIMVTQIYNDGKGTANGQDAGEATEVMKNESLFFPELYAVDQAMVKGMEEFEGQKVYTVVYGESDKKFYYNVENGLLVGRDSELKMGPQSYPVSIVYSDYKAVDGVMFPHSVTQKIMGQEVPLKVNEIKVNEGVTAADFE